MNSFCFSDAANIMLKSVNMRDKGIRMKSSYLEDILTGFDIIYRGDYTTQGRYVKQNVLLLNDEFIREHPEASVYFEEKIVNGKWYQLRITERGVNELFDYIVHVLGKELF